MSERRTAHNLTSKPRTDDVKIEEDVSFGRMLLADSVSNGLRKAGFVKPSPIQLKAIPLGKCGFDMIVQAKSGTGKTCVFAVVALEMLMLDVPSTQVLVLAPTREIANQITQVVTSIGRKMEGLQVKTFIGGLPVLEDKKNLECCHIAVGTPGRVRQLLDMKVLSPDSIRLFVLDEADKLVDESFLKDVNFIFTCLPQMKQVIALSATYPPTLASLVTRYMRSPEFVEPGGSRDPILLGVRQFVSVVKSHPLPQQQEKLKIAQLQRTLKKVSFSQCLVFTNFQVRAKSICEALNSNGWNAEFITASQDQTTRLEAMSKLKRMKVRILLATDLLARGIDSENINFVVNFDVPWDSATYLHRIGRSGRYGSYGLAVTLAADGSEVEMVQKIVGDVTNLRIYEIPETFTDDLWKVSAESFKMLQPLVTNSDEGSEVEDMKDDKSKMKPKKKHESVSKKSKEKKREHKEFGTSDDDEHVEDIRRAEKTVFVKGSEERRKKLTAVRKGKSTLSGELGGEEQKIQNNKEVKESVVNKGSKDLIKETKESKEEILSSSELESDEETGEDLEKDEEEIIYKHRDEPALETDKVIWGQEQHFPQRQLVAYDDMFSDHEIEECFIVESKPSPQGKKNKSKHGAARTKTSVSKGRKSKNATASTETAIPKGLETESIGTAIHTEVFSPEIKSRNAANTTETSVPKTRTSTGSSISKVQATKSSIAVSNTKTSVPKELESKSGNAAITREMFVSKDHQLLTAELVHLIKNPSNEKTECETLSYNDLVESLDTWSVSSEKGKSSVEFCGNLLNCDLSSAAVKSVEFFLNSKHNEVNSKVGGFKKICEKLGSSSVLENLKNNCLGMLEDNCFEENGEIDHDGKNGQPKVVSDINLKENIGFNDQLKAVGNIDESDDKEKNMISPNHVANKTNQNGCVRFEIGSNSESDTSSNDDTSSSDEVVDSEDGIEVQVRKPKRYTNYNQFKYGNNLSEFVSNRAAEHKLASYSQNVVNHKTGSVYGNSKVPASSYRESFPISQHTHHGSFPIPQYTYPEPIPTQQRTYPERLPSTHYKHYPDFPVDGSHSWTAWYQMWQKQLRQINQYVYQVSYWKNITEGCSQL